MGENLKKSFVLVSVLVILSLGSCINVNATIPNYFDLTINIPKIILYDNGD